MIIVLFIIGIGSGAIGSILMKAGAIQIGHVEINSIGQALSFLFHVFTNIACLGGIGLYFFSALIWQYLLTKLPISYVQPILALTYVATPVLAMFFLGEQVPAIRWLGIAIIILGVYIVAKTTTA